MTPAEWALLRERAEGRDLATRERPDGFVELRAGPCPFFTGRCAVYEVRPFNCRRYLCGRTEDGQVWEHGAVPPRVARSPQLLTFYQWNQRKAQSWARAHGW